MTELLDNQTFHISDQDQSASNGDTVGSDRPISNFLSCTTIEDFTDFNAPSSSIRKIQSRNVPFVNKSLIGHGFAREQQYGRVGVRGGAFCRFASTTPSRASKEPTKTGATFVPQNEPSQPIPNIPPVDQRIEKPMRGRPRKATAQPLTEQVTEEELYKWTSNPKEPEIFAFTENPGIIIDVPDDATLEYFFNLFLNNKLLDMVVKTNAHAIDIINRTRPSRHRSRSNDWYDTTCSEMRKFIGLILHMGIIKAPSFLYYWKTHPYYEMPSVMGRDRFQLLLRFWYFGLGKNDRLHLVQFLIDHLNKLMKEIIVPEKELSLNESIMLWWGRLLFRQYIKNKHHKYGVQFFELCQSDRLILRASIYCCKSYIDHYHLGQSGAVVIHLMKDFLDKGYELYADNYYNSVKLSDVLGKRSTHICGTFRKDQKHFPKKLISKKEGSMRCHAVWEY